MRPIFSDILEKFESSIFLYLFVHGFVVDYGEHAGKRQLNIALRRKCSVESQQRSVDFLFAYDIPLEFYSDGCVQVQHMVVQVDIQAAAVIG